MKLEELMERIYLPGEARKLVRNERIGVKEYGLWKDRFDRDIMQFIEEWKLIEDGYTWALEFYLKLALDTYEEYRKKGYGDPVSDQTFYDITIWCRECERKYGVYGLEELAWLGQSGKMMLFRLGRLQFEPIVTDKEMRGESQVIPAETRALNVHIPAGEPLVYEECQKSFHQALDFFGQEYQVFVCDSWLLSPHLKEILPRACNIIRFQNLFQVTEVDYDSLQPETRIFGEVLADHRLYPEDTSLQKRAKEYMLSGHKLGNGVGFFIIQ